MINRRENWIAELPPEARARVEACAIERTYRPGEQICAAGEPAAGIQQVLDGYIKVTGVTAAGNVAVVVIYGPGNCWGESPIIADRPHHHTTTAMTAVRIRHVPRAAFLQLYNDCPPVSIALCRKFSHAITRLIRRGEAQAGDRMPRLVAGVFYSFVRDVPGDANTREIPVPFTQSDIADFLGVTRQSVQPAVAELAKAGIVEKRRNAWQVRDLERLKRRATRVR